MTKSKKLLLTVFLTVMVSFLFCQPAFAISESEVQAQVDAVGKEAVSGNVLIWFLCAIAFFEGLTENRFVYEQFGHKRRSYRWLHAHRGHDRDSWHSIDP